MELLDLENKWFYRLVKVMYIFFLAIGFIGVLCIGWSSKPYQLVDNKRSYLICPNGTKHSFHSFDLYFYLKESFSDYDAEKTIEECKKHLKKGEAVIASGLITKIRQQYPAYNDLTDEQLANALYKKQYYEQVMILKANKLWDIAYPAHWVYKTEGSWFEAIKWWTLGSLVTFLIFNVIKQSLLYVVYGKKLTLGCRKKS